MADLLLARRRRAIRRAVQARCRALHWGRFEATGERLLDLSPHGALLACDGPVDVGDEVLVTFRMPWLGPHVVVLSEVARVVEGRREHDRGYCAGLRFLDLEPDARADLRARLALLDPPPPARSHPVDYAQAVRAIGHRSSPEPPILVGP